MAKPTGRIGFFCCFDPSLADADDGETWHKGPAIAVDHGLQASAKVNTWLNDPESAEPEEINSSSSCQTYCLDTDGDSPSDAESIG